MKHVNHTQCTHFLENIFRHIHVTSFLFHFTYILYIHKRIYSHHFVTFDVCHSSLPRSEVAPSTHCKVTVIHDGVKRAKSSLPYKEATAKLYQGMDGI